MLHKKIRAGVVPITFRNQIHLVMRRWQVFGPKKAILYYGRQVLGMGDRNHASPEPIPIRPAEIDPAAAGQPFSLETSSPEQESHQNGSARWGLIYEPSSGPAFRAVMRKVPVNFENFTFIDLGAGKGYALCLAAEFPFKKVIGVEYSQPLATAAAENLRRYGLENRKCHDVSCIFGDALKFAFPPQPTILYLYNPFQGPGMDRMIANLKQSLREHPRDFWIYYANPWEHRKFRRSRGLEVVELAWDYALYRYQTKKIGDNPHLGRIAS